jgi:hypothetical protein
MSHLHHSSAPTNRSSLWRSLEKPITGLLLTVSLVVLTEGFPNVTAQGAEVPLSTSIAEPSTAEDGQPIMFDGVYLYGQSPEADQVGSTYVVFEVERDRVVGAFYMPQSSFNCFEGQLQPDQMQLTVLDSYEQVSYSYAVAMQPDSPLANRQEAVIAPTAMPGYHSLATLSDTDHRLVASCKQRLANP